MIDVFALFARVLFFAGCINRFSRLEYVSENCV